MNPSPNSARQASTSLGANVRNGDRSSGQTRRDTKARADPSREQQPASTSESRRLSSPRSNEPEPNDNAEALAKALAKRERNRLSARKTHESKKKTLEGLEEESARLEERRVALGEQVAELQGAQEDDERRMGEIRRMLFERGEEGAKVWERVRRGFRKQYDE